MDKLRKKDQLTIRFTTEQLRRLRRAAKIVTVQRGDVVVDAGTLAREYITAGVDVVLAESELQETT